MYTNTKLLFHYEMDKNNNNLNVPTQCNFEKPQTHKQNLSAKQGVLECD